MPVDVHSTGPADSLSAGAAESKGRVNLVLDLDESIENLQKSSLTPYKMNLGYDVP